MLPALGSGAGQAIEVSAHVDVSSDSALTDMTVQDAYILGRLLAQHIITKKSIQRVLEIYDTVRRPVAHQTASYSMRVSRGVVFYPEYLPSDIDFEKVKANDIDELKKVGNEMEKLWSFTYSGLPEEEWIRAKELLDAAYLAGHLN